MKAISLKQPYASLVAIGEKRIETRSWNTNYRGPIAIHASAGFSNADADLCQANPFNAALGGLLGYRHMRDGSDELNVDALPFGCIVAITELIKVVKIPVVAAPCHLVMVPMKYVIGQTGIYVNTLKMEHIRIPPEGLRELEFGDYTPGRYAWIFANVTKLETPVKARGSLGLWNWEGDELWETPYQKQKSYSKS